MPLVCLEVSCAPNGTEKYPVPTTIRLARVFAGATDAAKHFDGDLLWAPDAEYAGQDVYYVLWDTSEPLNIDRTRNPENIVSNCGHWLSDEQRLYGNTELEVEMVPPEKLRERERMRRAAERTAKKQPGGGGAITYANDDHDAGGFHSDDDGYASRPTQQGSGVGISKRRRGAGNIWNKYL